MAKRKRTGESFTSSKRRYSSSAKRRKRRSRNYRTGGYLGIENKFLDTSLTSKTLVAATDATGLLADPTTLNCLNVMAQGDTPSGRDGKKVNMKRIDIRGIIQVGNQANQTVTDIAGAVTLALVLDTQTNGAQFASNLVFTNPSASVTTNVNLFRNLEYVDRFKVLKTKTIRLPQPTIVYDGTNIEQGGYHLPFKMGCNLNNLQVLYKDTAGTVADIVDNSLHLVAYCTNGTLPVLNYNARLRFIG